MTDVNVQAHERKLKEKIASYSEMLKQVYGASQLPYTDNYFKFRNRMSEGFNAMWLVQHSSIKSARLWMTHFHAEVDARHDNAEFNIKEYWALKDQLREYQTLIDNASRHEGE